MGNIKISVVIPIYNAEKTLRECLDSVLVAAEAVKNGQMHAEVEILCVNDGSTDCSLEMLRNYPVKILVEAHSNAGHARNLALENARGEYVAFVDADDAVAPDYLSKLVTVSDREKLDVCVCATEVIGGREEPLRIPKELETRAFQPAEIALGLFNYFGQFPGNKLFRRSFLLADGLRFPSLSRNEDLTFCFEALAMANRIGCVNEPLYRVRKWPKEIVYARNEQEPESYRAAYEILKSFLNSKGVFEKFSGSFHVAYAASERKARRFSPVSLKPLASTLSPMKRLRGVIKQFMPFGLMRRQVTRYGLDLQPRGANCLTRLLWDCVPYGLVPYNKPRRVAHVGIENFAPSWWVRRKFRRIERLRAETEQDLYVVTGQLNSRTNEAIDSLTFFEWLQSNGIPSRYIIWKKHPLYERLKREGRDKDVIALRGNGVDDMEILSYADLFVRARAFVQETAFLPHPIQTWLRELPGCRYVFLGHGPCGIATIARQFFSRFNDINATSVREKILVDDDLSRIVGQRLELCFVAGMARYDKLEDLSDRSSGEFVVFVMFTWRDYFRDDPNAMRRSQYWKGIETFLSKANRERLARRRIRLVVSLHHHLINQMGTIDLGEEVTFVNSTEISYWIRHAHACVTDFSSVSFDFLFLHKPTCYWIPDKNDPTLDDDDVNGGGKVKLALSLQKNFYNICESCEDVLSLLEKYADSGFALEPEKAAIADTYFTYRKDFCRHIYEEIEKRLKS